MAEVIAETNFPTSKRFKRIGIPDVFPDKYGSQASQKEEFDITSANLVKTIKNLRESINDSSEQLKEIVKE